MGAGKFCRDRLFIFVMSLSGKFISGLPEDRIFIFNRNKFLKKQKKNKKKTKKKWEGGFSEGLVEGAGHMSFYVLHNFCRLLARNIAYIVAGMFFSIHHVYVYDRIYKCLKGGGVLWVLPQNFFLAVFIQNGANYAIMMGTCTKIL